MFPAVFEHKEQYQNTESEGFSSPKVKWLPFSLESGNYTTVIVKFTKGNIITQLRMMLTDWVNLAISGHTVFLLFS